VNGPKKVLVIGASTGFGLASRITAAYASDAATIGVFFEKEPQSGKTASAGWYNSAAFSQAAKNDGLYAKNINGDAFSDEIKQKTIALIKADLGQVDMIVYSLASPVRMHPVTGVLHRSTLKPIGNNYSNKTVDFHSGNYGKAKSAYDEFMQQGTPDTQDYEHYAMLLYLNKDYAQSLNAVEKGLDADKDNHLLKRLRMYDLYEMEAYKEGLEAADAFFNRPEESNYVYLDFLYRGRLSLADQRNEEALQWFEKALKADTGNTHPEIAKEVSAAHEKLQNYPEAIRLYQLYLDGLKEKAEISDTFLLGRLYYMAAGSSTVSEPEKEPYLKKADEIFAEVAQRVPDNYLGYFWRARTNAMADPESTEGLAKPYYEAALNLLEKKADASKALIIECESYLGYYHFLQKDYEQSKVYWNKILTLDPENETAKQALQGLQGN
jgi:tetratricopeptide (TPR) repeat protein